MMGERDERTLQERIAARLSETDPNQTPAEAPVEGEAPVDQAPAEAPAEAPVEATPAQDVNPDIPAVVPESQPAQSQPAQPAPQNGMLQYLVQRLQAAEAQNAQLQQQLQGAQTTVQQQSQAAQGAMETAASQPSITIPVLDFNEMQYDDDATRAEKMNAWQSAMVQQITDAVSRQYAGQLEPIREEYESKKAAAQREAARQTIWGDSRFSDFRDRDEQIRKIIESNPELQGMDASRSYLMGGMIARGLDYNPNPSAEEIVRMVQNSPDAQRMLDSERARQIAERNNQIPTIQPSSGMATANAIPESTPTTKDDLFRRAAQRLGG